MKIGYFDIEEFPRIIQKIYVGTFAVVSVSILWQLMVAVQQFYDHMIFYDTF